MVCLLERLSVVSDPARSHLTGPRAPHAQTHSCQRRSACVRTGASRRRAGHVTDQTRGEGAARHVPGAGCVPREPGVGGPRLRPVPAQRASSRWLPSPLCLSFLRQTRKDFRRAATRVSLFSPHDSRWGSHLPEALSQVGSCRNHVLARRVPPGCPAESRSFVGSSVCGCQRVGGCSALSLLE